MGMQQIITLVLVTVLIGIAIAVGVTMFANSAYRANVQAIATELETFRARASEYWRLPVNLGGAGQDITRTSTEGLALYLGFEETNNARVVSIVYSFKSNNAEYHFDSCVDSEMVILALGTESRRDKFPFIRYTFDMMTNETQVDIDEAEGF